MSDLEIQMEIIKIKNTAEEVKKRSEVILNHVEDLNKMIEKNKLYPLLKFQIGDYLMYESGPK